MLMETFCSVGYLLGASFVYNFKVVKLKGHSVEPEVSSVMWAVIWPIAIVLEILSPITSLGRDLAYWQINREKTKETSQIRKRIVLMKEEQELAQIEAQLEEELSEHTSHSPMSHSVRPR